MCFLLCDTHAIICLVAKEAPQATKTPTIVLSDPKLPKVDPSISPSGALTCRPAPLIVQPLRPSLCAADGLVKELAQMINGENQSVNDVKGRWARASWST